MALPDVLGVIRGLQIVIKAGIKLQESTLKTIVQNSSLKTAAEDCLNNIKKAPAPDLNKSSVEFLEAIKEAGDRLYTIVNGVNEFLSYSIKKNAWTETIVPPESKKPPTTIKTVPIKNSMHEIKLTASDKELLKKLDMEHRQKLKATATQPNNSMNVTNESIQKEDKSKINESQNKVKVKAVPNPKSKQMINAAAKERTVPSSRIARMASFGSLAAGLGVGTAAEFVRRSIGIGDNTSSNMFLTKANMDRITDTLCKVRGAALKIGQMLSIQDESIVGSDLAKALERVRQSADFMPSWQVEQVLQTEIGESWKKLLSHFEEKPFAAASIGQVHFAKTKENKDIAIKIQYPGVAKGIESDIDNLVGIMKVWNVFPKGMFIDNVVVVAKRELAWEVNYTREAECTKRFKQLLKPYPDYYVPKVIDEFCSSQVFTTEYIEGIPIDECMNLDVEHRKFIAHKILELCLLELMKFRYMQTDPNWANFFYNPKMKKLLLLDFGASREYPKPFVDKYVKIIKAASENDKETVLKVSRELGFLTGYESKIMEEAHVDAVMILGEIFQYPEYKFNGRETVMRIQNLVPTMLTHRLCPPPDEIYSLHRKLSGIYVLCAKLDVPIRAQSLFLNLYNKYKFDRV